MYFHLVFLFFLKATVSFYKKNDSFVFQKTNNYFCIFRIGLKNEFEFYVNKFQFFVQEDKFMHAVLNIFLTREITSMLGFSDHKNVFCLEKVVTDS